jgi:hypothetical protein
MKEEASGETEEQDPNMAERIPRNAVERMEAAMNFLKRRWEA